MKHIVFENAGEIDLRSISTFGCSVKESKSPIGFFGTGLKFSIAVLLRLKCSVVVQCGNRQMEAKAVSEAIRGKDFDVVFLGDIPLGFTTELGKTWAAWMAYRELYCNAKDEQDHRIYISDEVPPATEGKTRFIVSGSDILTAHASRHEFILENEPAFRVGSFEVHQGAKKGFFYKGIKVMEFDRPALYTYNQTDRQS